MYRDYVEDEEDRRWLVRAAHLGRARAYGKVPLKAGDMTPEDGYFDP